MKGKLTALALFALSMVSSGQKIIVESKVSLLALGDSYTIGESVERDQRWPYQFMAALNELGIKADEPDYIATTGWTTTQLIRGIDIYLEREKDYNLVSILIGVNNQYQGIDISIYEPELEAIIARALEVVDQNHSRVFMLSIPDYAFTPFGEGREKVSKELDEYNAINKRLAAKYDIAYIDITPISREGLNNPSLVAVDGLHPSGVQYHEWIDLILPNLELKGVADQ